MAMISDFVATKRREIDGFEMLAKLAQRDHLLEFDRLDYTVPQMQRLWMYYQCSDIRICRACQDGVKFFDRTCSKCGA
jgi:hypothetical protein